MPKRVDGNSGKVVEALRQIGAEWIPTSGDPSIGFDGLTLWRGRSLITEIKDGNKPPSARKLTVNELKRQRQCEARGVPYLILLSAEHAIEVLGQFR